MTRRHLAVPPDALHGLVTFIDCDGGYPYVAWATAAREARMLYMGDEREPFRADDDCGVPLDEDARGVAYAVEGVPPGDQEIDDVIVPAILPGLEGFTTHVDGVPVADLTITDIIAALYKFDGRA